MIIACCGDIALEEKIISVLLVASLLLSFTDQQVTPECVRYELHESSNSSDVINSLTSNCVSKKGFIEKRSVKQLSSWPTMYNVTFECCSNFSCVQDVECPFNFNCDSKQGKCLVSDCELSDQIDHVLFEGASCTIHEDCAFFVPYDYTNWKCVVGCTDSIDGCATCQRCPNNSSTSSSYTSASSSPLELEPFNIDLSTSSPPSLSSFSTESDSLTIEAAATTIDPGPTTVLYECLQNEVKGKEVNCHLMMTEDEEDEKDEKDEKKDEKMNKSFESVNKN